MKRGRKQKYFTTEEKRSGNLEAAKRYKRKHPDRVKKSYQKWYSSHKEDKAKSKRLWNLNNYALTEEKFNAMLLIQDNGCAICKKPFLPNARINIDHDHSCCPVRKGCHKCVRSLLCNNCNRLLGMANDNISVLQEAVVYLKKFQSLKNGN